jgi:hypothetical protein
MAYNTGHAGNLQGSLPCYDAPPLRWRSGLHNTYTYKQNAKYYNFPENVPWDRNWGRGDVSCWAVNHQRPFNVVDDTRTPQYLIEPLSGDYRYLSYFDKLPVYHYAQKGQIWHDTEWRSGLLP